MDDRPSVTETDRGVVYEMDRQTKCKKRKMPLKLIKFYKIFFYRNYNVLLHLIYFSGLSMYFALFCLSVSEAHPLSVSVALGGSVHPFLRHFL